MTSVRAQTHDVGAAFFFRERGEGLPVREPAAIW